LANFVGEVDKGEKSILIFNNKDATPEDTNNFLSVLSQKLNKIADFECVDCVEDDPDGPFYDIDLSFYVTK
jgi:hypothetical protein